MLPPITLCRPLWAHASIERSNRQAPTVQDAHPNLRVPIHAPRRHGNQGGADPQPRPAPPLAQSRSTWRRPTRKWRGRGAPGARSRGTLARPRPVPPPGLSFAARVPHPSGAGPRRPLPTRSPRLAPLSGEEPRPGEAARAEGARPRGRRRFVSAGSEEEPGRAGRRPGRRGAGPGTAATRGAGLRVEARTARR